MKVYVPRGTPLAPGTSIARGSGIVGSPVVNNHDVIVIDYEGNLYDAANIVTYADRVAHAAGRHKDRYPTRARMYVPRSDLIEVGEWDGRTVIVNFDALPALAAWLDVETIPSDQLYRYIPVEEPEARLFDGNR